MKKHHEFPSHDVARTLRSSCRELTEVVRMFDANQQSDMAGQLHALTVEIRQLARQAESRASDVAYRESENFELASTH